MRINELEELIDISDSIIPEEDPIFNPCDAIDLLESCIQIMTDYIEHNVTAITEPDFEEDFKENIQELMFCQFEDEINKYDEFEDDIIMIIEEAWDIFFNTIIPFRSYPSSIILTKPNINRIESHLKYLRLKPQPIQRTDEWYKLRHNLITASNAYKCFESQSMQNQIIFEKCQPLKVFEEDSTNTFVNVNTTLHWGQKYEPLSVLIYEFLYKTKVEDFGCIPHDDYPFLGASPDGIVVNKESDRFGRMLEIKNIVNREIDGIPKKEYWIQMQLQMATWNLDECDFLETRFIEYTGYDEFRNDNCDNFKGVIMYFSTNEGKPKYYYKPIEITHEEEIEKWEEDIMEQNDNTKQIWIKNIYWKLDQISCVLVLRNKLWFEQNIGQIEHIWNIIEEERKTGYEHRCPNKRIKIEQPDLHIDTPLKCLIKLI
jgi:putative phage-type endonuclease